MFASVIGGIAPAVDTCGPICRINAAAEEGPFPPTGEVGTTDGSGGRLVKPRGSCWWPMGDPGHKCGDDANASAAVAVEGDIPGGIRKPEANKSAAAEYNAGGQATEAARRLRASAESMFENPAALGGIGGPPPGRHNNGFPYGIPNPGGKPPLADGGNPG